MTAGLLLCLVAAMAETGDSALVVRLPEPARAGAVSVEQALWQRRSVREFADEPLALEQVGQLCWATYGITLPLPGGPAFLRGGLRAAPSAGALYPLELFVFAGNVTGLDPGVWRYRSETHELVLVRPGDRRAELAAAALGQEFIARAPAALCWSAVFSRTTNKYGARGRERYVMMDLGHSGQNVWLQAVALGLGAVAVGAFVDEEVKLAAGMDAREEPLYIMPVGRPRG
ncbi:SagB/ThcOx family dehydrogenase [candidate division WOR-3 bacterium]|nr:SagB/ThcOx family dehydrogenase [candidate division WOR-3 bacterium]